MSNYLTQEEERTQTMGIWAIPAGVEEIEAGHATFTFELKPTWSSCWQDGAVKVCEQDVTYTVPGGINLVSEALATLEKAKEEIMAEAQNKLTDIDRQISALMQITFQPS